MNVISGTKRACEILSSLSDKIKSIKGRKPSLAFVLVGNHPSSQTYIQMKKRKCLEVGIVSHDLFLPQEITQQALIEKIVTLNHKSDIDGILVQLPLPNQIDPHAIMETIDPTKDVDGFHPLNMGKLLLGEKNGFTPCTPLGIYTLLIQEQILVSGKRVVILGRSNIVGKPLAALLMQKELHANATVTLAHSGSEHLQEISKSADILIAAIGKPNFVQPEFIKKGAVVIDVGINTIQLPSGEKQIIGDVDFNKVAPLCSAITPVPGGVGPMTIAMLLSNTLLSYNKRTRTQTN